MLGLPVTFFANQTILEVGPGSGYNTLAFFKWGAKVDLVEPNATGRADMQQLFFSSAIPKDSYVVYPDLIDHFATEKTYKIIIAEGFLHFLENKQEIITKLAGLLDDGGVIVVTCMDEVGLFVEQLKRLIGHILTRDMNDFEDKVKFLAGIFAPQLKCLTGVTRSAEDWVKDQVLNPKINHRLLEIPEAISLFGDAFEVLGTSQAMFVDYSWYKDVAYDYKSNYEAQYSVKRHNLVMAGLEESILTETNASIFYDKICKIRQYSILCENRYCADLVQNMIKELNDLLPIVLGIDNRVYRFILESIEILNSIGKKQIDLAEFGVFFSSFGRSQQYLSLVKKMKY